MTDTELRTAFQYYIKELKVAPSRMTDDARAKVSPKLEPGELPGHIVWMATQGIEFVGRGDRDKAMRWLGFIQGALWGKGLVSIDESREVNLGRRR